MYTWKVYQNGTEIYLPINQSSVTFEGRIEDDTVIQNKGWQIESGQLTTKWQRQVSFKLECDAGLWGECPQSYLTVLEQKCLDTETAYGWNEKTKPIKMKKRSEISVFFRLQALSYMLLCTRQLCCRKWQLILGLNLSAKSVFCSKGSIINFSIQMF